MAVNGGTVTRRATTSRVGVAGNPSDGHDGAVFAVPLPDLTAQVEVRDPVKALADLDGWSPWCNAGDDSGTDGLLEVAGGTLRAWLQRSGHPRSDEIAADRYATRWRTAIPRSVGLAGSSALIIALLRALDHRWELHLDPLVIAALAIEAETATTHTRPGWQDRVVQCLQRPVLVDCAELRTVDGLAVPHVEVVDPPPAGAPGLVVGWSLADATASHVLRQRMLLGRTAGFAQVMAELAQAGRQAAAAYRAGDREALSSAVTTTAELRRRCDAMTEGTDVLVRAAEALGLAATSAGSGGSAVAVVEPDDDRWLALADAWHRLGAEARTITASG